MEQKVSVAGIVTHRRRVLTLRRSKRETFMSGMFELPGGKVEFGEAPEKAILREVYEESGLKVKDPRLLDVRSYMSKNGTRHNIELFYLLRLVSSPDRVRLSKEHDMFRWISKNTIDQLGLPGADPIRGIIEHYFRGDYK